MTPRIKIPALAAATFFTGTVHAGLPAYDAAIAADHAGALPYTAISTEALVFDTTAGTAFDFGPVEDSSTIEFILHGDPTVARDGFLAVGANGTWNLRYEQWDDTGALGFTHLGVVDYVFDPEPGVDPSELDSPTEPTHVTYRWDQETTTMELYLDGTLKGTNASATAYEMPTGMGFLGAKDAAGAEGMSGTIERVTVYNDAIDPLVIRAHAEAWLGPDVPFQVSAIEAEDGGIRFTFPSVAGQFFRVEKGTDLASWTVIEAALPAGLAGVGDSTTFTDPAPAAEGPRAFYRVTRIPPPPTYGDDFESGPGGWTAGALGIFDPTATEWELGAPAGDGNGPAGAVSGSNAWGTDLDADYVDLTGVFLRSPLIDLSGFGSATLRFQSFVDTDPEEGGRLVILQGDGLTVIPNTFDFFTGDSGGWSSFMERLPDGAAGQPIYIQFEFLSGGDPGSNGAGWFIDDVEVRGN